MSRYYKEKIKNLIAFRTNLFTCLVVLTGGVFGLFIIDIPVYKIVPLALLGIYFGILFLKNLLSINNKILEYLEELK